MTEGGKQVERDLLPCPFCGERGVVTYHTGEELTFVECESCDITGPKQESYAEAVDAWNTRAASTPEAAALCDDGANYVANKESGPTEVRFSNGRRVWIAYEDGKPYLEVSMMAPDEAWLRNVADAEDGAFVGVGMTPYNAEVLAIVQARQVEAADLCDVLDEIEDYLEGREDADHNGERFVPNKEMRLLLDLRAARHLSPPPSGEQDQPDAVNEGESDEVDSAADRVLGGSHGSDRSQEVAALVPQEPHETDCPDCSHPWNRHKGYCRYIGDCSGRSCGCMNRPAALPDEEEKNA